MKTKLIPLNQAAAWLTVILLKVNLTRIEEQNNTEKTIKTLLSFELINKEKQKKIIPAKLE